MVVNQINVSLVQFNRVFVITFGIAFGLPGPWKNAEEGSRKPDTAILNELSNIKTKLDELTKEVEEIKKAIEE